MVVDAKVRHMDLFVIEVDTEGATVVVFDGDVPAKFRVIDVTVDTIATVSSGTVKVTDGSSDITNAIVAAVTKVVTRAGTIDPAKNEIAAGGSLSVVVANSADARVFIHCVRTD